MNPGGDFLAAYWLARLSDGDDTTKNLSPYAREALPYTLGGADGGTDDDAGSSPGGAPEDDSDSGCGCAVPGETGGLGAGVWVAGLLAWVLGRRGRRWR